MATRLIPRRKQGGYLHGEHPVVSFRSCSEKAGPLNSSNQDNSQDWPILPLDLDALARGTAIDAQVNLERKSRNTNPPSPEPVELSFHCRNITVSSYIDALKIAHNFDQVVSLGTVEDFPADLFPEHPSKLRIAFDDVTGTVPQDMANETLLPSEDHIREVLTFASLDKRILIHCQAGVSRSPAMAILLAWHWAFPLDEILSGMNIRKIYPNRLVLLLGEKILGLKPGSITGPIYQRLERGAPPNPPLPAYHVDQDGFFRSFEA